jgi:hypothetical protein
MQRAGDMQRQAQDPLFPLVPSDDPGLLDRFDGGAHLGRAMIGIGCAELQASAHQPG